MYDIRQMVREWGPALIALLETHYWICLYDGPAERDASPIEFWVGAGFDEWQPKQGCMAIIVVLSASSVVDRASPTRQRLVCGVSRSGEAYAVISSPTGGQLIEGVPHNGRLLDAIRSKLGLPPGPPAVSDLELNDSTDINP
jgi:hypothetical protein